jgi:2-polyprenyl-6-methoxyphenol hydroxylase-like FAD-dependent oxidoreductase
MISVPVLIVGSGPVGLTASLLLSQFGIPSLLVEKHPGTATLPKARAINARTMEMYRQMSLDVDITAAGMPPGFGGMLVWAESLAGKELNRKKMGRGQEHNLSVTPSSQALCAQDDFEPVLRKRAESIAPQSLRFNTEMTDFQFDEFGVTGTLSDRVTNQSQQFQARYLIAADGAKSQIRRTLKVNMVGTAEVYDSINIHFRSDLRNWIADRPASLYFIEQPTLRGTFLTINAVDRWCFLVNSLKQYGYQPADFTPDRCVEVVRQAVGVVDLDVKILGIGAWTASALVAERYRFGPIFLAGDAAHEMPPTGGFGLNTGVQDVQNLVWKLAAVLKGHADDALLDTYDAERRPMAEKIVEASHLNAVSFGRTERHDKPIMPRAEFLNEQGLIFGARYMSSAILPDGIPLPELTDEITEYTPSANPGCRAPHVWLMRAGERISTIDLFGKGFVLFVGPRGENWIKAAQLAMTDTSVYQLGTDLFDLNRVWFNTYEVADDGAVLVRPDGYIAWRSRSSSTNCSDTLKDVYESILRNKRITNALTC